LLRIERDNLTKILLKESDICVDEYNIIKYSRKWWMNNRMRPRSFRLTSEGLEFLSETMGLMSYEITFTEPINMSSQILIYLSRYIECPYFLNKNSIIVFSEETSFELFLFSDDIRKFGLMKATKHAKMKANRDRKATYR